VTTIGGVIGAARFRALLVAAVVATFLTGLAQAVSPVESALPSSAASAAVDDDRETAVRELLDRRAQAVRTRDETAFLGTLDPAADQGFRDRQRDLFHNLAAVPLAQWDYEVDPTRSQPVADGQWAPGVRLDYRFTGVDAEPSSRPMAYLFARRDGRWLLNSDTAVGTTWRGPWDFGPCHVLSSPAGFVLSHPGGEALAARALAELNGAVGVVTEVWGTAWSRKVALLIPSGPEELQSLVGPGFAVDSIAGVAVADRVDATAHIAQGQRVVLNPAVATGLSPLSLRVLLRHEITHIAARADTVDGAPMWLLEGFADYVGYRGSEVPADKAAPALAARLREAVPTALPTDAEFRGAGMDLAYQEAWSVNQYLARRLGEPGLVELYRRLAGKSDVDTVLRDALGVDRTGLVADWQAFLMSEFAH
jgi:hypothetical protein